MHFHTHVLPHVHSLLIKQKSLYYIRPIYRVWALTCTRIILYIIFTTGLIHDSPVVVCMRAIYCTQPFCQLELHYVCKGHEQDMVTTAVEAHCCINIWTKVNYMSKIRNRKSKNPGCFDLEGLRQPRSQDQVSLADKDRQCWNVPGFYFSCCIFCSYYNWLLFMVTTVGSY